MQLRDERGSAVAEFAMVAGLLTVVALAVMQLALGMYVRNVVQDAAAEGARYAALVGGNETAGVERTEQLIDAALGDGVQGVATASTTSIEGVPAVRITVTTTLPLVGLLGPTTLEVQGHAALEVLE